MEGGRAFLQGESLRRADKIEDAVTQYERALGFWRELKDQEREAEALARIGWMLERLDRWEEAVDLCTQAASLYRQAGDTAGQAVALNRAGRLLLRLSRFEEALSLLEEAVRLFRATSDREGEAAALTNLGNVHLWSGRFFEAVEVYEQLLSVLRGLGDSLGETIALLGQGDLYLRHGEWSEALDSFESAKRIAEKSGHRKLTAATLDRLGTLDYRNGRLTESRAWSEHALVLYRELDDRRGQANTLNLLGSVLLKAGDRDGARTRYEEARALFFSLSDAHGEATATSHLGRVALASGDARAALSLQREALASFERLGNRPGLSLTHYEIAQALHEVGDPEGALLEIQASLALMEHQRTEAGSRSLWTFYFGAPQQHWELYIDILLTLDQLHPNQGFAARALEADEQRRARSLSEALAETRAEVRRKVEPTLQKEAAELQRRLARVEGPAEVNDLLALLDAFAETRTQVPWKTKPAALWEEATGLRRRLARSESPTEVSDLLTNLDRVYTRMRVSTPLLASIEDTRTLFLPEIQRKLLDTDTLLLIYSLGEKRSLLWKITRSTIASFELPPRERIETSAYRIHDILSNHSRPGAHLWQTAVDDLSELILRPVANDLQKYRRLVIVADGALQKVPFGALPDPGVNPVAGRQPPLVERHPIIYLPSASVGATLRWERRVPPLRRGSGPLVAVVADPVFDASDSRVSRYGTAPPPENGAAHASLERAMRSLGISRLERLPYSRGETQAIQELRHRSGEVLPVLDFAANRQVLEDERWRRAPILHFATHVLLNDRQAELSGLVFSLVNPDGSPRQDGFLPLHEIYDLTLDADLVVLSACQTGNGRELRGEGLLGLTRGFLSVGAPQIVVSLWKVEDQATTELMTRFYREIFNGYRPPEALQRAQTAMLRNPAWEDPALWAGFVFVGDYERQPGGGIEARDTGGADLPRGADSGGLPPPKVKPKAPKRERRL